MKTSVSNDGRIAVPAAIREQDGIDPGQEFDFERLESGRYRLQRCQPHPNQSVVDWLLACPEKDFVLPIESESTDTL